MSDSPRLPPHHSGVVLDAPSAYQEYDELRELMAEDRRRRATTSVTVPRGIEVLVGNLQVTREQYLAAPGQSYVFGIGQAPVLSPLPRAERRARGRRIQKVHAYVRRVERQRTNRLRAQRPVIKKGLTR